MSLYDITADYRELFDNFDNADDLTDEQIEAYFDTLEAIEGDFAGMRPRQYAHELLRINRRKACALLYLRRGFQSALPIDCVRVSSAGTARAQAHDRDDLLNYGAPKVAKTAVKNAIHDGAELPEYVKLVRTTSVIIK